MEWRRLESFGNPVKVRLIAGNEYTFGGMMSEGCSVSLALEDGTILASTKADGRGTFRFTASDDTDAYMLFAGPENGSLSMPFVELGSAKPYVPHGV